jgi:lysophospholipase L1-like esterase
VNELFVRQGLPFVRVDLGPEDRLPGILEDHPNPRGARAIAAAVERALRTGLGPAQASLTRDQNR